MRSLNRNNIVQLFTSEWLKKLVAIIFAAGLWWFVNFWSYTEQSFSLPIQFKNLPADLVVLETSDTTVSFIAKGKAESVKNISMNKSIKPIVYLDDAKPGTNLFKIELVLNEPQSDLIINLLKDKVRLRIDRIATRVLPVQPVIIGTPAEGFIVDNVILDKNTITVKGPSEILASMEYIETKAVQVNGISNDMTQTVALELQKMVTALSPEKITVTVNVAKKKEKTESGKKD